MYLNRTSGNLNPRGEQPQSNLQISTVRQFDGGLNVTDTDLNMAPRYAKVLDNIERAIDGTLGVRPGTKLFSDKLTDTAAIVNMTYFVTYIVTVQASGRVSLLDGTGNVFRTSVPWPAGSIEVNFTIFNSDLIICNGRDKPLIISGDPTNPNYLIVQPLVDLGSISNVHTPICKYVVAHGQYTCFAGASYDPSTLFISQQNTSGTFYGDPAPNDAVNIDLGPRVSLGSSTITGLVAYRDKLLVTFERGVLPINLGVYTGSPGVHTPTDDGFIEEFGCLTHRSLVSVGDDTFYCDNVGVNSISRVNVFNTLRPVRASHLIDPLITSLVQPLSKTQISQYVFSVYDLRNFRYMLFVPVLDSGGVLQETIGFSFSNIPALKVQAWARLRGWKWQCACRTALQNIMFAQGNKIYFYDFDNPVKAADFLGDTAINSGNGVPINFEWEMPWTDFKHRMNQKQCRYVAMDTQGTARFTIELYVDNLETDQNGNRSPMLVSDFFGGDANRDMVGNYRLTSDERLYAWPMKFNIMKLRFWGATTEKLKFVSVSIAFLSGSLRR